jgi:hypothetical protein
MKTIKKSYKAEYSKIGDLITYRALPTHNVSLEQFDPFLFLNHHGPQVYKPNNQGLPFGPHPHKGFETVTFILKGDILHKDTQGHESVIQEGGIQWMTAGKGIIHSEVSSKEFKAKGGEIEILQLWINLPSKLKSSNPSYIGLQRKEIPLITEDQEKVKVHLISGSWKDVKAPIQSLTNVCMSYITLMKGAKLTTSVDISKTVFYYVVKGEVKVNGSSFSTHDIVEFNKDGDEILTEASSDAILLFGYASPTREPIVARGPFVMNSLEEIREAYEEFEEGKFGDIE